MAWSLQDAGHTLAGWEGVVAGDVPLGAGLSSSAALEMATARAFAAVGRPRLERRADGHARPDAPKTSGSA